MVWRCGPFGGRLLHLGREDHHLEWLGILFVPIWKWWGRGGTRSSNRPFYCSTLHGSRGICSPEGRRQGMQSVLGFHQSTLLSGKTLYLDRKDGHRKDILFVWWCCCSWTSLQRWRVVLWTWAWCGHNGLLLKGQGSVSKSIFPDLAQTSRSSVRSPLLHKCTLCCLVPPSDKTLSIVHSIIDSCYQLLY